MKKTILTPAKVRAIIQSHADGEPNLVERLARELEMTPRQLFNYQRYGVQVNIPDTAARLLEVAGVEIQGVEIAKKRGKK